MKNLNIYLEGLFDADDAFDQAGKELELKSWMDTFNMDAEYSDNKLIGNENSFRLDIYEYLIKKFPLDAPLDQISWKHVNIDELKKGELNKLTKSFYSDSMKVRDSIIDDMEFTGAAFDTDDVIFSKCKFNGFTRFWYDDPKLEGKLFKGCKMNLGKECYINIKAFKTKYEDVLDLLSKILKFDVFKEFVDKRESFRHDVGGMSMKPLLKYLGLGDIANAHINIETHVDGKDHATIIINKNIIGGSFIKW